MKFKLLVLLIVFSGLACYKSQNTNINTKLKSNQEKNTSQDSLYVDDFLDGLVYTKNIQIDSITDTRIKIDTVVCSDKFCHITKRFKIFDTEFLRNDYYYGLNDPKSSIRFVDSCRSSIEVPKFKHKLKDLLCFENFSLNVENIITYNN